MPHTVNLPALLQQKKLASPHTHERATSKADPQPKIKTLHSQIQRQ